MRQTVLAVLLLGVAPLAHAAQGTCTSWEGASVQDLQLSDSLVVARITGEGDGLVAIPVADPEHARGLSVQASTFRLASTPGALLLITQRDLKGDIVALRLRVDGTELGAPFTVFPAGADDRHLDRVFFDGQAFAVVVRTGSILEERPWLVRVSVDGDSVSPATALVVATQNPWFLPGPVAGDLWIMEYDEHQSPWHVTARLRSLDGSLGPVIDLGAGRIRGAAASLAGELLVLVDPDQGPDGTFASVLTPAGPIGPAVAIGGTGYWDVAARPSGGYVATQGGTAGLLMGILLDATGAPAGGPAPFAPWTPGQQVRLTGSHLAWSDRIEAGDHAESHATVIVVDAAGPGPATLLYVTTEDKVEVPCGTGCTSSVAGRNARPDAPVAALLLGAVLVMTRIRARRTKARA